MSLENGIKFTNAIVRTPCLRINEGITTVDIGKPDYQKALQQHMQYVSALTNCGLNVTIMEADLNYPDSTFVEDVAVLTEKCAIVTSPGAATRKGEEIKVEKLLKHFYHDNIERIKLPGTLEGGDILRCSDHFFIGLSNRTNEEGAHQLISILNKYGYTGSTVKLKHILHLKTGIVYLGNGICAASGELVEHEAFKKYKIIKIDESEAYAANVIKVNETLIMPSGFPKAKANFIENGFSVVEVNTSEYQKIDGGLSCLSLRFLLQP